MPWGNCYEISGCGGSLIGPNGGNRLALHIILYCTSGLVWLATTATEATSVNASRCAMTQLN